MKRFTRDTTSAALALLLFSVSVTPIRGLDWYSLYVTAMPTWIYNGFTVDAEGEPVQGSDVSPLRMTFGIGADLRLAERHRLEPQIWIYLQEYAALREFDKTVPTQIETGAVVADIANTLSVALSIPWLYSLPWPASEDWTVALGGGLALIFRIPIQDIDGTDGSAVGGYWIDGRFVYPQVNVNVDYRLNDRYEIGGGVEWFIPVYNAWAQSEEAPFLDETMVRAGVRLRYLFPAAP